MQWLNRTIGVAHTASEAYRNRLVTEPELKKELFGKIGHLRLRKGTNDWDGMWFFTLESTFDRMFVWRGPMYADGKRRDCRCNIRTHDGF